MRYCINYINHSSCQHQRAERMKSALPKLIHCVVVWCLLLVSQTSLAQEFIVTPVSITQTAGNHNTTFIPAHLIDGSGLSSVPVTLANVRTVTHTSSPSTSWVTGSSGSPNYYNGTNPDPQFVLDLGSLVSLSSLVIWGYGGNTNEASNFRIEYSENGGANYSDDIQWVQTEALVVNSSDILIFSNPQVADFVRITIVDNAGGRGFPGPGGDRVGFGELRFIGSTPTPCDQ